MDRDRTGEWLPALLTAGSFLAMLSTWIVALCDALDNSLRWRSELALGFACAAAFASLLARHDPHAEADVRND